MENRSPLKRTPLYENHLKLKARMVPFAGYEMPVQYTSLLDEAKAVRASCGLFDVSHMGQFVLKGKSALEELEKLVTNDLRKLTTKGQAQYNLLCNEEGGVIDDLIIYFNSPEDLYICVNASNRAEDFAWMKSRLSPHLTFIDESDSTALLALQGPKAVEIMSKISDPDVIKNLKYYRAESTFVYDFPCYLSRTGYTGEDGFELYLKAEHAPRVWDQLLEQGKSAGITPCGLGARDTLRLEMGYPLHGHELGPKICALGSGVNWVVKLDRAQPYVGQAALQKVRSEGGPKKLLKAFIIEDKRMARQGYLIKTESGELAGEITSGTLSPQLSTPIAMGFIDSRFDKQTRFMVQVRDSLIPATTTSIPFVARKVVA